MTQSEDTRTTVYYGVRGDLLEIRVSRGGDIMAAIKVIAELRRANVSLGPNWSFSFDNGPSGPNS